MRVNHGNRGDTQARPTLLGAEDVTFFIDVACV
jgi:hypothetical protein